MDVASTFSLSGVFNIFADGEDLQGGHHSRPAGGALVAGDDEADGAEPNGQRLAVLAVDEQDRPAVEGVVKLGEREDNVVVVAAMDQHNQAQLLASELFAELDPGPGQEVAHRHPGIGVVLLFVEIEGDDVLVGQHRHFCGGKGRGFARVGDGQERRGSGRRAGGGRKGLAASGGG